MGRVGVAPYEGKMPLAERRGQQDSSRNHSAIDAKWRACLCRANHTPVGPKPQALRPPPAPPEANWGYPRGLALPLAASSRGLAPQDGRPVRLLPRDASPRRDALVLPSGLRARRVPGVHGHTPPSPTGQDSLPHLLRGGLFRRRDARAAPRPRADHHGPLRADAARQWKHRACLAAGRDAARAGDCLWRPEEDGWG